MSELSRLEDLGNRGSAARSLHSMIWSIAGFSVKVASSEFDFIRSI